jgi:hypothetical protein
VPFASSGTNSMATQLHAAVRLQAVTRSLLARQRLHEMRRQMRDREAALATVIFAAKGCNLDSFCGYQQLHQLAAISKGAHGVFPQTAYPNSAGKGGRGGAFLFVAGEDTLPSALAFHFRPSRGRLVGHRRD